MAIIVPQPHDEMRAETFAAPVAERLNGGGLIRPPLLNSWVDFDVIRQIAYMKKAGIVFLFGVGRSGLMGQPMFNLPPGYRPIRTFQAMVNSTTSGAGSGEAYIAEVGETGNVRGITGSNTWFYIDSISFAAVEV